METDTMTLYDGESGTALFANVPVQCIRDLTASGDCGEAAAYWLPRVTVLASDATLLRYVRGCGAESDLPDSEAIRQHALWIACGSDLPR